MKNKFIVYSLSLIVILLAIYHIPYTIYASESTPSADIKAKLEELKKQIASKAAKLKQEVNRKLKDKAYVGIIQSKSDNSFTLATSSDPKIVSINEDTIFESSIKGKQKFSQKTIALADYVAALGDVDETGVLLAKKIVLLPKNNQEPKISLWGQVISVSDQLATIRDKERKNVAAAIPPSSKVNTGDVAILTGNWDKNDIFDAGFVYIIPGVKAKIKKLATPSANAKETPKATSSAKSTLKKAN